MIRSRSTLKTKTEEIASNIEEFSSIQFTSKEINVKSIKIQTDQYPNRLSRSPNPKFAFDDSSHEQVVRNRRSKTLDLGKGYESSMMSGSGLESQMISEKSKFV